MSWYRIYRPQSVAGLHLVSVREQLLSFMKAGNFPHAMLLTGPKGTGKTSSARIIAKVVNCDVNANKKPKEVYKDACLQCASCLSIASGSALNVVEIDAASHRRIDDVRELRENVYLPPVTGQKNVYIIDEVHMMTNEAFNALLKILEEPPVHAMFILATTEAHKIPETIVSRCTTLQFHKPSIEEVSVALEQIATAEKINLKDPTILAQIVQKAQGSFRDAVKLFEQVGKGKSSISATELEQASASLGEESTVAFLEQIIAKNEQGIVRTFQQWQTQDLDPRFVHTQILEVLHTHLLRSLGIQSGKSFASTEILFFIIKAFSQVVIDERLPFPLLPLELCALEMVLKSKQRAGGASTPTKPPTAANSSSSASSSRSTPRSSVSSQSAKFASQPLVASISPQVLSSINSDEMQQINTGAIPPLDTVTENTTSILPTSSIHGAELQEKWNQFLQLIGQRNISIEALLRSTQFVKGNQGKVTLKVFYGFHKEQLELDRYRSVLEECSAVLLGQPLRFEFILDTQAKAVLADEASNISGQVEDQSLAQLAEEILV